ncbi:GNAT family N-acetyltransferase [Chitinibacter sp. SCUT-21]|uniref:GNAT family N-acetyltransferase n=1 Tax=Chitinibacter sp. SCUT-21 TaxID=2970891 RepID=UPI0035A6210A
MPAVFSSSAIRTITPADLPRILAIQAASYPAHLLEDEATFLSKLQFAGKCSWLIEQNGQVLGYLFTHPWHGDTPPALNRAEQAWPSEADRFYLHDLAIHPDGRGLNLSRLLSEHALNWARQQGYSQAMLVAVGDAQTFWQKMGFSVAAKQDAALQQYGQAVLMLRDLSQ